MTTSCHICKRTDLPPIPGTLAVPVPHVRLDDAMEGVPCPGGWSYPLPHVAAEHARLTWENDNAWDLLKASDFYVWE